ncbi:phosphoribosylformylglycinamidine synthase subunit [Acrasis kona]|uniref:Phosphoribosylformylglycinamidine synthase subunit n=1 Tax=Acrasis kona TaxID=1008807 RepID=A0AAW2Z6E6_9EUKA
MEKWRVDTDTSFELSEGNIQSTLEKEGIEKDSAMVFAHKKKTESEKKAKESENMEKTISTLKSEMPTIRLKYIIEDLFKFEKFIARHNFEISKYLPLFMSCVEDGLVNNVRKLSESKLLEGKSWRECKKELLEKLTGKRVTEYMSLFRKIRPRRNETYDEYHQRFSSYMEILDVSNADAELIYYESVDQIAKLQAQIRVFRTQHADTDYEYRPEVSGYYETIKYVFNYMGTPLSSVYFDKNGYPAGVFSSAVKPTGRESTDAAEHHDSNSNLKKRHRDDRRGKDHYN